MRLPGEQVPTLGRATIGVRLIRLDTGDHVTSVAVLEKGIENGNGEPEE
ncbi:MAG TPA: DNA gyrase C-terminal beta-propeller domain-containing protein [Patescibacteria group bacterium]|nr:DNA gyrase C-terminal beta-propeller domain-containing protein [Patescibacteria group bacterium]